MVKTVLGEILAYGFPLGVLTAGALGMNNQSTQRISLFLLLAGSAGLLSTLL